MRIRDTQVLVIEGVKDLPPELEVSAFRKMKIFGEGKVSIPESWRSPRGWP